MVPVPRLAPALAVPYVRERRCGGSGSARLAGGSSSSIRATGGREGAEAHPSATLAATAQKTAGDLSKPRGIA
jgi:hypothetical protein